MRTFIYTILAFFTVALFTSTVYASDRTTKTYSYKDFSNVSVSSGMHLTVTQSNAYSIEVIAEQDDFKYLVVEKEGNDLKFYYKRDFFSFNWGRHHKVDVNIKMPALTGVELSGGSIANFNMDISSKKFDAGLSGGSQINATLKCGNISLELSGGSVVELSGSAKNISIEGSGGSIFKLKNCTVNDVNAELSGGSQATVTMSGTLNTSQSGGSHITYYGKASIGETEFSGGSGVSKGH